ncbi:hypothetical protein EPUS_05325 [Endocarpon pusillum Z07020]|uniref:Uncharacterized protein n=1 Tax=Endocarpon pusillum (strain Z07020 / HMAS-L-300199) TaxID=1263415 RepID=U1GGN8_ENDPU|nr:uncharacterized protein EPUS_05325 [Endocarpon pusillum Z07020]ERF71273.1 hypothetical protein EPUS_05325 [Endocarpon pusillum Z07020]
MEKAVRYNYRPSQISGREQQDEYNSGHNEGNNSGARMTGTVPSREGLKVKIPFAFKDQLCDKLCISSDQRSLYRTPTSSRNSCTKKFHLPGEPRITLEDACIENYLESELVTRDLDKLAPHLWLVAKQDSSHVSSLTHQIVRGREIIVTEKPELHLVWIYDRVFIKPIPKYLLSHAFWAFYLINANSPISKPLREDIARAALGFLRSYLHLIRHKSDFTLAKDDRLRLLPKNISYSNFVSFIMAFDTVEDTRVSPRYQFGELRLTRLNFWSKIFLHRFTFQKVHGQYGAHFAQFYGPILFVFGSLTQFEQFSITFSQASRGFSIFTLIFVALVALFLISILCIMCLRETVFAIRDLHHRRMSGSAGHVLRRGSSAKSMA